MSTNPEGFEDRPVPVRPLDEAQARMLELLRSAQGRPVTFAELRSRGIENPAVLCYELEIAGVPITHVERQQPGRAPVPVGVQLDEQALAAAEPPQRAPAARDRARGARVALLGFAGAALTHSRAQARRATEGVRKRREQWSLDWDVATARRTRMGLLLGATALLVAVALVIGLGTDSGARPSAAGHSPGRHRSQLALAPGATRSAGSRAGHSHSALAVGAGGGEAGVPNARRGANTSAGRALQLQGEGHQLLAEGRYAAAAADLRAAIAASGESPTRCEEPSSEACLAYAYALYDLGRALQAQDKPGAAVPILNERLHIDNQRATVEAQLNRAREQMRSSPPRHHKGANAHTQTRAPSASQNTETSGSPPGGTERSGAQPQTPASGTPPSGEGSGSEASPGADAGGTSPGQGGEAAPPDTTSG